MAVFDYEAIAEDEFCRLPFFVILTTRPLFLSQMFLNRSVMILAEVSTSAFNISARMELVPAAFPFFVAECNRMVFYKMESSLYPEICPAWSNLPG